MHLKQRRPKVGCWMHDGETAAIIAVWDDRSVLMFDLHFHDNFEKTACCSRDAALMRGCNFDTSD